MVFKQLLVKFDVQLYLIRAKNEISYLENDSR